MGKPTVAEVGGGEASGLRLFLNMNKCPLTNDI